MGSSRAKVRSLVTKAPRKAPKSTAPPAPPARKRGGQAKPPGLKSAMITTTVPPEVGDWLASIGDNGSQSNGLRKAAIRAFEAAAAESQSAHAKQSS